MSEKMTEMLAYSTRSGPNHIGRVILTREDVNMAEPPQTTDIVQRLRAKRVIRLAEDSNLWTEIDPDNAVRVDAAAEIERLRALVREALDSRVPDYIPGDWLTRAKEALAHD